MRLNGSADVFGDLFTCGSFTEELDVFFPWEASPERASPRQRNDRETSAAGSDKSAQRSNPPRALAPDRHPPVPAGRHNFHPRPV